MVNQEAAEDILYALGGRHRRRYFEFKDSDSGMPGGGGAENAVMGSKTGRPSERLCRSLNDLPVPSHALSIILSIEMYESLIGELESQKQFAGLGTGVVSSPTSLSACMTFKGHPVGMDADLVPGQGYIEIDS